MRKSLRINPIKSVLITGLIFSLLFFLNSSNLTFAQTSSPENESGLPKTVKLDNQDMTLEAEQINYSGENGLIEATGTTVVTAKKSAIRMETAELTYNSGNGVIKVPGMVKITTDQGVFYINSFEYNLKTEIGSGGSVKGTAMDGGRVDSITGKSTALNKQEETVVGAKFTRCSLPNPHYYIRASRMSIKNKKVHVSNMVLYIKGIPVFYLPFFSYRIHENKQELPDVQLTYDGHLGVIVQANSVAPINDNIDFHTNIHIETTGTSNVDVGVGTKIIDNLYNHVYLSQSNVYPSPDVVSKVLDNVTYNTSDFLYSCDLLQSFHATDERQLGLAVTKKFWQGWGGDWQFGVSGKESFKI